MEGVQKESFLSDFKKKKNIIFFLVDFVLEQANRHFHVAILRLSIATVHTERLSSQAVYKYSTVQLYNPAGMCACLTWLLYMRSLLVKETSYGEGDEMS